MNKDALLRLIAESAYNIGYAAKKHLATYDLVEKVPGWIGLVSLAVRHICAFHARLGEKSDRSDLHRARCGIHHD